MLHALGLPLTGGNYRHLNRAIEEHGLDTSHFVGQAKGRTAQPTPLEEQLIAGRGTYNVNYFSKRLRREKVIPYQCGICGQGPRWQGRRLVLVLNHINRDRYDCRKENLRFLCPNCRSQL